MGSAGQGADATQGRWLVIPRTLVFVTHGSRVLLIKRAPHKRIFPNQYNGLGGHVERGEDVYHAALREVEEESGLTVHDLRLRGVHQIDAGADTGILLFIFTAAADSAAITVQSPEGTLEWVEHARLDQLDLVEDVFEVLTRVLAMPPDAPPYFAHVSYDPDDNIVFAMPKTS